MRSCKPKVEPKREYHIESYSMDMLRQEMINDQFRHMDLRLHNALEENEELKMQNEALKRELKKWTDPEKVDFT